MVQLKVYKLLEKGSHGQRFNKTFDHIIMTLIMLSVISIIFESIPEINDKYGKFLLIFDIFSIFVFTIEYGLRIYVAHLTHPSNSRWKSIKKFIFSSRGIIDLIAILPFYLPFLVKMDLRFIRMLRIVRFLRILKLNRYNNSIKLIADVIKEKKPELMITSFVTFLILLIASFLMYYIEGPHQPEQFSSVLQSFWWAVATLTTVGYGDVYPVTGLGKLISGLIAIMGIGLVALPTGLISAGFMHKIEQRKKNKKCPHCGKKIDI